MEWFTSSLDLEGYFYVIKFPNSSLLNRMCKDALLLMYSRFLGCPATLVMHCGVELSTTLLNSWRSDIVLIGLLGACSLLGFIWPGVFSLLEPLFLLSRSSCICILTFLDFLFLCCNFLLLIVFLAVCIGFDLRGPTLLGFLDGHTTSFHESTSSSGLVSESTCPKTQCLGKLMENWSVLSCYMDI